MGSQETFRISSHLKDIIGRDLVTNEFIAIFELVKNSFDAGAEKVDIEFDPANEVILIVDDGHGMSADDIRNKWLFVAYSDKASAAPDYRDKIRPSRYAGSKGIGRFACDTLGSSLSLYSKARGQNSISKLDVDWTRFEEDSTDTFQDISVQLTTVTEFPAMANPAQPLAGGTVIVIKDTRTDWDVASIRRLRRELAKLIDPFGTTSPVVVSTWLLDGSDERIEDVDGPVGNNIADLLQDRTSRILVKIAEGFIETTLIDRGRRIYKIREPSPYRELDPCAIEGQVFFLNRSAKHTFTSRMGVRPIEFGSIFLFLNGFRISPIGDEFDDAFGLNRRKQQGQSRYLGTRDLIGRVDVVAPAKMFREVSSRDAGLVDDANRRALYEAIMKYMIQRLERYVVGVNWADSTDHDRATPEGLETDDARGRLLTIVGGLARSKDIEILYYDSDLLRLPDDTDQITDGTLRAMVDLAEKMGDAPLLNQIEVTKRRIEELQAQKEEARAQAYQAIKDREVANARIAVLERQAAFLGSSLDIDVERVQLLMHQATIHAGHVRSAISNAAHEIQNVISLASGPPNPDEYEDVLASIRQSARRVSSSIAGATLSGDRLKIALSFAPNIRVDLETDKVTGDMLTFMQEYFAVRLSGVPGMPEAVLTNPGLVLRREFSPIDLAVLVDNLQDNAKKARASRIEFSVSKKSNGRIIISVSDDGTGIDVNRVDPARLFDRGYTGSSTGTGIGLYSVRQIIQEMGGKIELVGDGTRADFELEIPGDTQ
jgi:signal transduction histidine kinase